VRLIAAILLLAPVAAHAEARPTVRAVVLPTRGEARAHLLLALATTLSRHFGGSLRPDPPRLDLADRLKRAVELSFGEDVDRAAALYDAALEDGAREPGRVADPAAFVTAHVQRAGLALARGEERRARELVSRVLAYDPTFRLAPNERSPQLVRLVEEVVAHPPELSAADLGTSCESADVVLAARRRTGGLEVFRFDRCRLVARAPFGTDEMDAAVAALRSPAPFSSLQAARGLGRRVAIAGGVLLAAGLALSGAGAYYAARAASEDANFNRGCAPETPCSADELGRRDDELNRSSTIAAALLAIGGASVIAGATIVGIGARRVVRVAVAPSAQGAVLTASGRF
jgi:hypothetical protein